MERPEGTPLDLRLSHGKSVIRLVTGRYVLGVLYGENRPKSENWAILTHHNNNNNNKNECHSNIIVDKLPQPYVVQER